MRGQQGTHRDGLVVAMLEQQPAIAAQMGRGVGHDAAQVVEPVGTGHQRRRRFVRQRRQMRIAGCDVGRIGDDQVVARGRRALQPVGLPEPHRQPQAQCVAARHVERAGTGVDGIDISIGPGLLQGQRDGAAAGAEVKHARRRIGGRGGGSPQDLQCPFDQGLGVRARHQHAGIDPQGEAVEFLLAEQVGHGFAGDAARDVPREACAGRLGQCVVVVGQQPGAVVRGSSERVQQQQLGVEPVESAGRRVAQGAREGRGGRRRAVRHDAHAGRLASRSASCSASRAPRRAARTSPRSPSMIDCSL